MRLKSLVLVAPIPAFPAMAILIGFLYAISFFVISTSSPSFSAARHTETIIELVGILGLCPLFKPLPQLFGTFLLLWGRWLRSYVSFIRRRDITSLRFPEIRVE